MRFFLFIFFNIFCLSFQGIPTAFFCNAFLRNVYLIEGGKGGNPKKIADGIDANDSCTFIYDLNVVPGDLIRYTCENDAGLAWGSGCFYVYDKCFCYDFDINKDRVSDERTGSAILGGESCSMKFHALVEYDNRINYDYEHSSMIF